MFTVDDENNITLTRGDTAEITLTVVKNGDVYDFSDDLTQLTVKRNTVTQDIIIQKTFIGDTVVITPADTKDLYYTDLKYDVQLITTDNKVYTVIPPRDFIIAEEVNFNVSRT